MMNPIMLRVHFDGANMVLDEPANLKPDTQLLVTVLPTTNHGESAAFDEERDDWIKLSLMALESAYGNDEPEYSMDMIKEPN
jgi:hypothetical protein